MNTLLDQLTKLQGQVNSAWGLLNIDQKKQELLEQEEKMSQPNFWNDNEVAQKVSQEVASLKDEIDQWEGLKNEIEDYVSLVKDAMKENDQSLAKDLEKRIPELQSRYEEQEFFLLLSGKYDRNNAIVAIHAGTGGADAMDWAEMLFRMYTRYAEKKNWQVEIVDVSRGKEAGYKSVIFEVKGPHAYGYLQSEFGVHRLVRLSPFNADSLRQTSFALVEVLPELPEKGEIELDENDLKIETMRSSGAGGQHVNKTSSAVRITHEPSGISVKCQNERSQQQNRETALKILRGKLHQLEQKKEASEKEALRGAYSEAVWGNQIRSYVLHPYQMCKDHRTGWETADVGGVLDGDLDGVVESWLREKASGR